MNAKLPLALLFAVLLPTSTLAAGSAFQIYGPHIGFSGDLHYRFTISGATWQPYAGGGVALHFVSFDNAGATSASLRRFVWRQTQRVLRS